MPLWLQISLYVWAVGTVIVWLIAWRSYYEEPTIHGQELITVYGCVFGLFWPIVLVWAVIMNTKAWLEKRKNEQPS